MKNMTETEILFARLSAFGYSRKLASRIVKIYKRKGRSKEKLAWCQKDGFCPHQTIGGKCWVSRRMACEFQFFGLRPQGKPQA